MAETDLINDALKQLHGTFSEAYATAISVAEAMPEQINNEIRSAVTHLARAAVATDAAVMQAEAKSAQRHMERANRDCYKLAVVETNWRIRRVVCIIERFKGGLTKTIAHNYNQAEKERKRIVKLEAQSGESSTAYSEVSGYYRELYRVLSSLQIEMYEEYHLSEIQVSIFPYIHWSRRTAIYVIGLFIAFVLGAYSSFYANNVVPFVNNHLSYVFEAAPDREGD